MERFDPGAIMDLAELVVEHLERTYPRAKVRRLLHKNIVEAIRTHAAACVDYPACHVRTALHGGFSRHVVDSDWLFISTDHEGTTWRACREFAINSIGPNFSSEGVTRVSREANPQRYWAGRIYGAQREW